MSQATDPAEAEYNFTLYANTSLSYGSHTIALQNGVVGGAFSSVYLDYIVYTTCVASIFTHGLT